MGRKTCFLSTCQATGEKGFFKFPEQNKELLQKWFQSLNVSEIPPGNLRVCWRHFSASDLHGSKIITRSGGKAQEYFSRYFSVKTIRYRIERKGDILL